MAHLGRGTPWPWHTLAVAHTSGTRPTLGARHTSGPRHTSRVGVQLDHLVVAAGSLDQGMAWCEASLGVQPGPGGRHPLIGTHNLLVRLDGDTWPMAYLEIIAIDPDASPPLRPRWFGLDDPATRAVLERSPRLIHWVCRSTDIERTRHQLLNLGVDPGPVLVGERETPSGKLRWRITVPDDGRLALEGVVPSLIEWEGVHPTTSMPASGLSLTGLTLGGLPAGVAQALRLPLLGVIESGDPTIAAAFDTPRGKVTLVSGSRTT